MKKVKYAVSIMCSLLLCALLLSSCSNLSYLHFKYFQNNSVNSEKTVDTIVECIKTKDAEGIKELFAENALLEAKNIDKSIEDLFSYVTGEIISYDGVIGSFGAIQDGETLKIDFTTHKITTTQGVYNLECKNVAQNTTNHRNVGLWSMYIINEENETYFKDAAYRSSGSNVTGINVNVPRSFAVFNLDDYKTELEIYKCNDGEMTYCQDENEFYEFCYDKIREKAAELKLGYDGLEEYYDENTNCYLVITTPYNIDICGGKAYMIIQREDGKVLAFWQDEYFIRP